MLNTPSRSLQMRGVALKDCFKKKEKAGLEKSFFSHCGSYYIETQKVWYIYHSYVVVVNISAGSSVEVLASNF